MYDEQQPSKVSHSPQTRVDAMSRETIITTSAFVASIDMETGRL